MSATGRRFRGRNRRNIHALKEKGCTCCPDLHDIPRSLWPAGAVDGTFVRHQVGCELGDRVAALNALGILPSILHQVRGCDR